MTRACQFSFPRRVAINSDFLGRDQSIRMCRGKPHHYLRISHFSIVACIKRTLENYVVYVLYRKKVPYNSSNNKVRLGTPEIGLVSVGIEI